MKCPNIIKILHNYYFINYFFDLSTKNDKIRIISIIKVLLFFSILPNLVVLGSSLDGTFFLPGNGKGLMEHYGVWSLFLTAPALLIISVITLNKFISIISKIEGFVINDTIPRGLKILINKHIESLCLKSQTKYLLLLAGIIGFFFSLINIIQTIEPIPTYGNDVFDSYPYFKGYLTNKTFLIFIWTLIYPVSFFIIVHISISMIVILRYIYKRKILYVDFFHNDNCGGVSDFGTINTLIMGIYVCIYFVFLCLYITHANNYFTLVLASGGATVIMVIHNILGVYYIQKFVKEEKSRYLERINSEINRLMENLSYFRQDLIILRRHISSIKPNPYTKQIAFFKNIFRFFPPAMALMKLFISP